MELILDSSVLIAAERKRLDWVRWQETLPDELRFITAITLAELWRGCHRARTGEQRQRRERFVRNIENRFPALAFGSTEAHVHARIWAQLADEGKSIGAHDLLIAAIALTHEYQIATLNTEEFSRVPRLKLAYLRTFLSV